MPSRSMFTSRAFIVGIHLFLWLAWLFFPFLFLDSMDNELRYFMRSGYLLIILAGFFYTNYFYLIPHFLLKKRIGLYILTVLAGFIAVSILYFLWGFVLNSLGLRNASHPMVYRLFIPVFQNLIVFALSTAIRITNEWFKNEKQKKEMENEKLVSELAFLKSQVNPHFLFNTLNNICSLARKKSDDTENALIKLSQIMRYMLYESKDSKVLLEKEIEYLQSYIELQKMRINEKVDIFLTLTGNPEKLKIEPMLLIPFVENAFKHGISYMDVSKIYISLMIDNDSIIFKVINTIIQKSDESLPQNSGIGLVNVKRRLELLYPDHHTLNTSDSGSVFSIELKMKLEL